MCDKKRAVIGFTPTMFVKVTSIKFNKNPFSKRSNVVTVIFISE